MGPQWTLEGNKLKGMAALILPPGTDEELTDTITRIASDRRYKSFNAVRVSFPVENLNTVVIHHALLYGMSVMAGDVDVIYDKHPTLYKQYIDYLYKKGVRIFSLKSAYSRDAEGVKNILNAITSKPDTFVVLSSGLFQAHENFSLTGILGDRIGVELRLYNGEESILWVDRWVKKWPTMSVAAIDITKSTVPRVQIKQMCKYILDGNVDNIAVLECRESSPDNWEEVLQFVHEWHSK
jgi:hypothetical protein